MQRRLGKSRTKLQWDEIHLIALAHSINNINWASLSPCSEHQAKELQLQLEQTVTKDEASYVLQERARPGKARTSKNKARRSPYPPIASPSDTPYGSPPEGHFGSDSAANRTAFGGGGGGEYSSLPSDMSTAGYMGLYASQEGVADRYGLYTYGHPAIYGDYYGSYSAARSYDAYRGLEYYSGSSSREGPYPGYVTTGMSSGSENLRALTERENYKTGLQSASAYSSDCLHSARSTSRDQSYYNAAYRSGDREAAVDAAKRDKDSKPSKETNGVGSPPKNSSSENQSSVIRSRLTHQLESPRRAQKDASTAPPAVTSLNHDGSREARSVDPTSPQAANSLYGANTNCFDSYKVSPFSSSQSSTGASAQRAYPMVPQAGYTSVIVDAQQYQMANGYVH